MLTHLDECFWPPATFGHGKSRRSEPCLLSPQLGLWADIWEKKLGQSPLPAVANLSQHWEPWVFFIPPDFSLHTGLSLENTFFPRWSREIMGAFPLWEQLCDFDFFFPGRWRKVFTAENRRINNSELKAELVENFVLTSACPMMIQKSLLLDLPGCLFQDYEIAYEHLGLIFSHENFKLLVGSEDLGSTPQPECWIPRHHDDMTIIQGWWRTKKNVLGREMLPCGKLT